MKGKQLVRRLRKLGVEIDATRGKGAHSLATYQGRRSTIITHGDRDLSPEYIKAVCKQLGIDPKEIL